MLSIMYMEGDGTDKNYILSWAGIISEAYHDLESNDWLPEVRESLSLQRFKPGATDGEDSEKRYQL